MIYILELEGSGEISITYRDETESSNRLLFNISLLVSISIPVIDATKLKYCKPINNQEVCFDGLL